MIDSRQELMAFFTRRNVSFVMKFAGKYRIGGNEIDIGEEILPGIAEKMITDGLLIKTEGFMSRYTLSEAGAKMRGEYFPAERSYFE
jgi:hypothetical protein